MSTSPSTYDQALNLVSHREHSRHEITQKLKQRGCDQEEIEQACQKLTEFNYLNDERFAEMYVRSKAGQGTGPARILQELNQKGIHSELAKQALEHAEADWFELAKQLKNRKFGEQIPKDFKEKAKQMRHLQYRGFNYDQIQYALSPQDQ